jgi:hypothetical protein
VKDAIPSDRMLIYDVGSGWEPICDFLGVPVPDAPYPRANDRAQFEDIAAMAIKMAHGEMP